MHALINTQLCTWEESCMDLSNCFYAILFSLLRCLVNSGDLGLPRISPSSPLLKKSTRFCLGPCSLYYSLKTLQGSQLGWSWSSPYLLPIYFRYHCPHCLIFNDLFHYFTYFVYFLVVSSGRVNLVTVLQLGQGTDPNTTYFDWVNLWFQKYSISILTYSTAISCFNLMMLFSKNASDSE